MDVHVKQFYQEFSDGTSKGHFHKVISLHESPKIDWDSVHQKAPDFCRGWFELARLESKDRIEFCRDFWIAKLPYHPKLQEFLISFFNELDEIGVYLIQKKYDDPFEGHLVYSLSRDRGFFKGCTPISQERIEQLQADFPDFIFPQDYLAFLEIHNGFCKTTDSTGITKSTLMKESYIKFQAMLEQQEPLSTSKGGAVNPKALIPFYESFGMPFYQCFWGEWYPEDEAGNVYYSGTTKTIMVGNGSESSVDTMAFSSFIDWLMFYLEQVE